MPSPSNVTLTFSDIKNASGTLKVENEGVISKVLPEYKNKTVTSAEFALLQRMAAVSGDELVLEQSDVRGVDILNKKIEKGDAQIESGLWNLIQGGSWKGDIYINIPKGTTMGKIKEMFNLPDGSLRNYSRVAGSPGGNMDTFETFSNQVWFSAEDFAKGNNMTLEEVKAMFDK